MDNKKRIAIMAHMIPFFPDENSSRVVVEALVEAGITWLEVQFPFTDPAADGPVIEAACTRALKAGFTVDKGFAFVRSLSDLCAQAGITIYIMTYASLVYARGVAKFLGDAKASGAKGVIVPDLPPDCDEGLYALAPGMGMEAIPVIIPTISPARLDMVEKLGVSHVYAALRAGITGTETSLDPALLAWLEGLKKRGFKVLGGFGIQTVRSAVVVAPLLEGVVVGSAIVRKIESAWESGIPANRELEIHKAVFEFTSGLVRGE